MSSTATPAAKYRERAAAYERAISEDQRRSNGAVYTPVTIARLVLDLAGYRPDEPIERRTLLDPSCGSGVFLVEAVSRLIARLSALGTRLNTDGGAETLLQVVKEHVFGIDVDRSACSLTAQGVRGVLREALGHERVPPRFFSANVKTKDFLAAPQVDLFNRRVELVYDFIVGNPPYVPTTRLNPESKMLLRGRFHSAHGRIDLYSLFMERATEILAPEGVLAFITPDKYLTSSSARRLRTLLSKRAPVVRLARFTSHRVFPAAATVPCITVCRRSETRSGVDLLELGAPNGATPKIIAKERIARPSQKGDPWDFVPTELAAVAHHLKSGHPQLLSLVDRLSSGIATGRDTVFVIAREKSHELESELLHPAVRGQDILSTGLRDPELTIIIPYLNQGLSRPALVNITDFPAVHEHLRQHREELKRRHCVRVWNKPWFDLHDPWSLDVTSATKILCPDVAAGNRFALEEGHFCPLHSAYYMIPSTGVDASYLVSVLNSLPLEFLVRLYAPVVKDGFSRYRKQFLATLPVPGPSATVRNEIVNAHMSGDATLRDELVCRLFKLTRSQREVVTQFLHSRRSPHSA